jgi:hypothetical protein
MKQGFVTAMARQPKVHPSTICRDIPALLHLTRPCRQYGRLPVFGAAVERYDNGHLSAGPVAEPDVTDAVQ